MVDKLSMSSGGSWSCVLCSNCSACDGSGNEGRELGSRETNDFRGIVWDFEEFAPAGNSERGEVARGTVDEIGFYECDWKCPEFPDGEQPLLAAFMDVGTNVMIKAEFIAKGDSKVLEALPHFNIALL